MANAVEHDSAEPNGHAWGMGASEAAQNAGKLVAFKWGWEHARECDGELGGGTAQSNKQRYAAMKFTVMPQSCVVRNGVSTGKLNRIPATERTITILLAQNGTVRRASMRVCCVRG